MQPPSLHSKMLIPWHTIHRGVITAGENSSGISVDLGSLYCGAYCKHLAQMARVIGGQDLVEVTSGLCIESNLQIPA